MTLTQLELERLAEIVAEQVADRIAIRFDADAAMDKYGAADFLKCSTATIERLTAAGEIASFKVGNLRRYRRCDLIGRLSQSSPKAQQSNSGVQL